MYGERGRGHAADHVEHRGLPILRDGAPDDDRVRGPRPHRDHRRYRSRKVLDPRGDDVRAVRADVVRRERQPGDRQRRVPALRGVAGVLGVELPVGGNAAARAAEERRGRVGDRGTDPAGRRRRGARDRRRRARGEPAHGRAPRAGRGRVPAHDGAATRTVRAAAGRGRAAQPVPDPPPDLAHGRDRRGRGGAEGSRRTRPKPAGTARRRPRPPAGRTRRRDSRSCAGKRPRPAGRARRHRGRRTTS